MGGTALIVSNKTKQLIVVALGLALVAGGGSIRLYIRDRWFQEPLCLLISMGRTKFSTQAPYSDAVDAVSTMGMGLFYTGLALLVVATAAWLFRPQEQDANAKTAA